MLDALQHTRCGDGQVDFASARNGACARSREDEGGVGVWGVRWTCGGHATDGKSALAGLAVSGGSQNFKRFHLRVAFEASPHARARANDAVTRSIVRCTTRLR